MTVDTLQGGRVVVRNPTPVRNADARAGWRLVEELRLGRVEGAGPDVFGDVSSLAVDDDGRIYVMDVGSKELRLFAGDGRHLRNMAPDGDGPGEFRYLGDYRAVWQPPNRIWIGTPYQRLVIDSLGNELYKPPIRFPLFVEGEFSRWGEVVAAAPGRVKWPCRGPPTLGRGRWRGPSAAAATRGWPTA